MCKGIQLTWTRRTPRFSSGGCCRTQPCCRAFPPRSPSPWHPCKPAAYQSTLLLAPRHGRHGCLDHGDTWQRNATSYVWAAESVTEVSCFARGDGTATQVRRNTPRGRAAAPRRPKQAKQITAGMPFLLEQCFAGRQWQLGAGGMLLLRVGSAPFVELCFVLGLLLLVLPVRIGHVHRLVTEQVRLNLPLLLLPGRWDEKTSQCGLDAW